MSLSPVLPFCTFNLDALNLEKLRENAIKLAIQTVKGMELTASTESRRTERCWRNSPRSTERGNPYVLLNKVYTLQLDTHFYTLPEKPEAFPLSGVH